MRRKTKMFAAVPAATLLMMGMATTGFAAPTNAPTSTTSTNTSTAVRNGWVSEINGKDTVWYYYGNGVRYRNQWVKSNDLWYYLDSDGIMLTGWQTIGSTDYFFDSSGAMATGWRKIVSYDNRGSQSYGPMGNSSSSGANWYYFATATTGKGYTEGEVVQGWLQLGDNWYYLADNDVETENNDFEYGQMVYGEAVIDGNKYYFGKENEGVMRTGFVKASEIDSSNTSSNRPGGSSSSKEGSYYYGTSGSTIGMKWEDAWLNLNNDWYYFDEEGQMVTGQMATDSKGKWCEYDSADASYYYYLDPSSGKMQTGWVNIKGSISAPNSPLGSSSSDKYYQYYDNSGAMHFGWLNIGGKYYYLATQDDIREDNTFDGYAAGQMVTDYKEIDGDGFFFNKSGVMETSVWKEISRGTCYFGTNGAMTKSESEKNLAVIKRSGRYYPVDTDGYLFPEDTGIYYNGSRYSTDSNMTNIKKTYTVHYNGYLVEVR